MITIPNVMEDHILHSKGGSRDSSLSDRNTGQFVTYPELIEEFGPSLGLPHTAPMGGGLFEIRAKGKEGIGRAFFCTVKGQEIVILHSFIKKAQRTPKKELEKARRRMKEID